MRKLLIWCLARLISRVWSWKGLSLGFFRRPKCAGLTDSSFQVLRGWRGGLTAMANPGAQVQADFLTHYRAALTSTPSELFEKAARRQAPATRLHIP